MKLTNNLNALGELVERYGYKLIANYLAKIVLTWHIDPQSDDAKIWRELQDKYKKEPSANVGTEGSETERS